MLCSDFIINIHETLLVYLNLGREMINLINFLYNFDIRLYVVLEKYLHSAVLKYELMLSDQPISDTNNL